MAEMIEFPSNGQNSRGYLATPATGSGPGVIVIQEWWGLDSGTKEMANRLATAGFVALAPDLYHGELAKHTEMDRAAELMQAMPIERAVRDMSGAVDYLSEHSAVTSNGIGIMGFCMGGMLTFLLAADRPDKITAAVPFYGFPTGDGGPNLGRIRAKIQGHMADNDDFFPPQAALALQTKLTELGVDASFTVHPGSGHAFMAPHDALGNYDAELYARIWPQAIEFLKANIT